MSFGTLTLGDMFILQSQPKDQQKGGGGGRWTSLWKQPGVRRATAKTHSLDSLVTDSAAGGCAWGCGRHINNGAINMLPDGTQVLPIQIQARQAGKSIGVVTTARVTHATPASFYANAARRDYEQVIADQLLSRGVDVALGGGSRFFPKELLDQHATVHVSRTLAELEAAPAEGRLLGIFDPSHVPFAIERPATVPGLTQMTRAALERLSKNKHGFVLQIEAGRVDHAAHNNDAGTLVREQAEFDAAIGLVADWAAGRDDTLIIITTDHANANPGLTLYDAPGNAAFARLANARRSFDWIWDQVTAIKSAEQLAARVPAIVAEASGFQMSPADVQMFVGAATSARVMPFMEANKWTSVLGALLADHYGVAFISPNHSADYVEVTALGPGADAVGGLMDNIDLHAVMVSALALAPGELLPDMRDKLKSVTPPKSD